MHTTRSSSSSASHSSRYVPSSHMQQSQWLSGGHLTSSSSSSAPLSLPFVSPCYLPSVVPPSLQGHCSLWAALCSQLTCLSTDRFLLRHAQSVREVNGECMKLFRAFKEDEKRRRGGRSQAACSHQPFPSALPTNMQNVTNMWNESSEEKQATSAPKSAVRPHVDRGIYDVRVEQLHDLQHRLRTLKGVHVCLDDHASASALVSLLHVDIELETRLLAEQISEQEAAERISEAAARNKRRRRSRSSGRTRSKSPKHTKSQSHKIKLSHELQKDFQHFNQEKLSRLESVAADFHSSLSSSFDASRVLNLVFVRGRGSLPEQWPASLPQAAIAQPENTLQFIPPALHKTYATRPNAIVCMQGKVLELSAACEIIKERIINKQYIESLHPTSGAPMLTLIFHEDRMTHSSFNGALSNLIHPIFSWFNQLTLQNLVDYTESPSIWQQEKLALERMERIKTLQEEHMAYKEVIEKERREKLSVLQNLEKLEKTTIINELERKMEEEIRAIRFEHLKAVQIESMKIRSRFARYETELNTYYDEEQLDLAAVHQRVDALKTQVLVREWEDLHHHRLSIYYPPLLPKLLLLAQDLKAHALYADVFEIISRHMLQYSNSIQLLCPILPISTYRNMLNFTSLQQLEQLLELPQNSSPLNHFKALLDEYKAQAYEDDTVAASFHYMSNKVEAGGTLFEEDIQTLLSELENLRDIRVNIADRQVGDNVRHIRSILSLLVMLHGRSNARDELQSRKRMMELGAEQSDLQLMKLHIERALKPDFQPTLPMRASPLSSLAPSPALSPSNTQPPSPKKRHGTYFYLFQALVRKIIHINNSRVKWIPQKRPLLKLTHHDQHVHLTTPYRYASLHASLSFSRLDDCLPTAKRLTERWYYEVRIGSLDESHGVVMVGWDIDVDDTPDDFTQNIDDGLPNTLHQKTNHLLALEHEQYLRDYDNTQYARFSRALPLLAQAASHHITNAAITDALPASLIPSPDQLIKIIGHLVDKANDAAIQAVNAQNKHSNAAKDLLERINVLAGKTAENILGFIPPVHDSTPLLNHPSASPSTAPGHRRGVSSMASIGSATMHASKQPAYSPFDIFPTYQLSSLSASERERVKQRASGLMWQSDGIIYHNGDSYQCGVGYGENDVIGLGLDLATHCYYLSKNGHVFCASPVKSSGSVPLGVAATRIEPGPVLGFDKITNNNNSYQTNNAKPSRYDYNSNQRDTSSPVNGNSTNRTVPSHSVSNSISSIAASSPSPTLGASSSSPMLRSLPSPSLPALTIDTTPIHSTRSNSTLAPLMTPSSRSLSSNIISPKAASKKRISPLKKQLQARAEAEMKEIAELKAQAEKILQHAYELEKDNEANKALLFSTMRNHVTPSPAVIRTILTRLHDASEENRRLAEQYEKMYNGVIEAGAFPPFQSNESNKMTIELENDDDSTIQHAVDDEATRVILPSADLIYSSSQLPLEVAEQPLAVPCSSFATVPLHFLQSFSIPILTPPPRLHYPPLLNTDQLVQTLAVGVNIVANGGDMDKAMEAIMSVNQQLMASRFPHLFRSNSLSLSPSGRSVSSPSANKHSKKFEFASTVQAARMQAEQSHQFTAGSFSRQPSVQQRSYQPVDNTRVDESDVLTLGRRQYTLRPCVCLYTNRAKSNEQRAYQFTLLHPAPSDNADDHTLSSPHCFVRVEFEKFKHPLPGFRAVKTAINQHSNISV